MSASKCPKSLILPVLLITVGTGWLLTTAEVLPGVDWVWVLGLAILGFLVLLIGGIDKVTVVVGPFLMISTIFSLLRQTGRLSADIEVPCLLIVAGLLAVFAHFLPVPRPEWLDTPTTAGGSSSGAQDAQTAMVGRIGRVETTLDPQGIVSIDGATYAATTGGRPISEGSSVRVQGYERSFVLVEEIDLAAPGSS